MPAANPEPLSVHPATLTADCEPLSAHCEPPTADPDDVPELDASHVIRPERFILPEVSGLAVPTLGLCDGRMSGRWMLYLRWADGRRERRPLGSVLELPDGQRRFIHPEPGEPTLGTRPGWSADARRRWLDGEPVPEPVDLFGRLAERFTQFIDLPATAWGVHATLAFWTLLSYIYPAFDAVPYLHVGGPPGSGKSRVLDVLARLAFRPFAASDLTAAVLFRTLHAHGGTLLLDGAKRLQCATDADAGEMLSLFLAGSTKGGAAVRLEPTGAGTVRTASFDVFGPKAIASASELAPALVSRVIEMTMSPAGPASEAARRAIDADPAAWQRLRDDLHALALEYGPVWLELAGRRDVCPVLGGCDYQRWQPLVAIAAWLQGRGADGLGDRMHALALESIKSSEDRELSWYDRTLLGLLSAAIQFRDYPTPSELLKSAVRADDSFRRWTPKAVAERLKRFGLTTVKVHGQRRFAQVTRDDIRRIQRRHGIDLGIEDGDRAGVRAMEAHHSAVGWRYRDDPPASDEGVAEAAAAERSDAPASDHRSTGSSGPSHPLDWVR